MDCHFRYWVTKSCGFPLRCPVTPTLWGPSAATLSVALDGVHRGSNWGGRQSVRSCGLRTDTRVSLETFSPLSLPISPQAQPTACLQFWERPWAMGTQLSWAGLLTHENCAIIDASCFKLPGLEVIHYLAIDDGCNSPVGFHCMGELI